MLIKYFNQVGEHWQIAKPVRDMVTFHQANLLRDLSSFGRFDIVFCRNVLIYFENDVKAEVLRRIREMMPQDGILYLGGAESVIGITEAFGPLQGVRGVYVCSGDAAPKTGSPAVLQDATTGLAKTA